MEKKPPIPPKQKPVLEKDNPVEENPQLVEQKNDDNLQQEVVAQSTSEQKKEENIESQDRKQKKSGKKSKINKKILFWCLAGLFVVALIIVAVVVFSPKYEKMNTPTVTVYTLSNQTIVYVEENKDAVRYDFCIQKQGENTVTYLSSNTNSISIVSKLKAPGNYYIWARYVGQNRQQNSDESEKYVYTYTKPLNAPNVNKTGSKLLWEKDGQAKEYRVYYGANEEGALYFVVNQPASSFANVEFDLSTLSTLAPGRYSLHVQSVASASGFYTDSELGREISYDNVKTLGNILTATFNTSTNLLTFTVDIEKTFVTKFEININGGAVSGQLVASELASSYTFDLTPYITSNVTDLKIKALGENSFVNDSGYKVCTIS